MQFFIAVSISFIITFVCIPLIIYISNSINLLDKPDSRKIHMVGKPSLGGIPITCAMLITLIITLPFNEISQLKFLLAGICLTFILGIRDDVSSLHAFQKLIVQLLASFLIVHFADIRITSLQGFLGLESLNTFFSKSVSMLIIISLTNAYNLIDGIDGLAGSIALIILSFFGVSFFLMEDFTYSLLSIILASGIVAFLYFNWFPSKIFMGDTGSMVIGFVLSCLVIKFIEIIPSSNPVISSPISVASALFILPIFDTIRVMLIRILSRKSPFYPDKNHLHHFLLEIGLNHAMITITLFLFCLLTIAITILIQDFEIHYILAVQAIICLVANYSLTLYLKKGSKKLKTSTHQGAKRMEISKSA